MFISSFLLEVYPCRNAGCFCFCRLSDRHLSFLLCSPAFFDDFERQTQGENFSSQPNTEASGSPSISMKGKADSINNDGAKDETLTEFFDEFEKNTGGEDFRREET
mmetsp:Transcript_3914/g.7693  ORF Transcript_3914/g.7693 Transcript_3914/m.7693 type:complete len:106 (+) Transcript_3914:2115-2432(+)